MKAASLTLSEVAVKTLEHLHGEEQESLFKVRELQSLIASGLTLEEVLDLVVQTEDADEIQSARELTADELDRVYRITRVAQLAENIFGNHEKAFHWLREPNGKFGGETPISYLKTERGGRLVEDLLLQVDYGVVA